MIKLALGWHQRVRLITFTAEELQVATVYEKLKGRLPLRDLAPDDPRVQLLDEACERYRRAARQKAWQARGNPTKNAQSN